MCLRAGSSVSSSPSDHDAIGREIAHERGLSLPKKRRGSHKDYRASTRGPGGLAWSTRARQLRSQLGIYRPALPERSRRLISQTLRAWIVAVQTTATDALLLAAAELFRSRRADALLMIMAVLRDDLLSDQRQLGLRRLQRDRDAPTREAQSMSACRDPDELRSQRLSVSVTVVSSRHADRDTQTEARQISFTEGLRPSWRYRQPHQTLRGCRVAAATGTGGWSPGRPDSARGPGCSQGVLTRAGQGQSGRNGGAGTASRCACRCALS
jgi:hypothetical protein